MKRHPKGAGCARGLWLPWLLVLGMVAGRAETVDPMKSPQCLAAIETLEARLAAMAPLAAPSAPADAAQRRAADALHAARQAAAHACLGARADAPTPRRADHPPALVAPTRAAAAIPTLPVPAANPLPPVQIPAPKFVTSCDLTGCWASDGTRLQRAGEGLLLGPKGFCTLQAPVLLCP